MKRQSYRDEMNPYAPTRGQSYFKNIQISWMYTERFGLSIAHLRCGVCSLPLESLALRLDGMVFLVCEEGHLVGNEVEPSRAEEEWTRIKDHYQSEIEAKKQLYAQEYHGLLTKLRTGQITEDDLREWEKDVPSYSRLPQFTKAYEYNAKLEEISRQFTEAYFGTARKT